MRKKHKNQRVIVKILQSNVDRDSPSSKTSASDNELSSEPILASIEQRNKDKRLEIVQLQNQNAIKASCLQIFDVSKKQQCWNLSA